MASFVPKPGSLDSIEIARKAGERPEVFFCIERGVLACYRPLGEEIRDELKLFVLEGICLSGVGFGQWRDRGDYKQPSDIIGGK